MKEVIKRVFNEEEKDFIRQYNESCLYSWERMSDSQKQEYQELENYYSIFAKLFSEYYEDLKLYSLMYRNVTLYNCANDAFSVLYFASKQDEIIGFKKQLLANKDSDKAQIAFLYYANEALFPKAVTKYVGINISSKLTKQGMHRSLLNDFKAGNYNHIFSICDINDDDCRIILSNKDNIEHDYNILQNECNEKFSAIYIPFSDEKEFAERFYIQKLLKEDKSFENRCIKRFIINRYNKESSKEFNRLKEDFNNYKNKIEPLDAKIRELKNQIFGSSFHSYMLNEKECKKKIDCLEQECKTIEEQKNFEFDALVSRIKTTDTCQFAYYNYKYIEQYITESYEKLYNLLWLRKPQKIRCKESHTTSATSIREIFKKHQSGKILRYQQSKKTKELFFYFGKSYLMSVWCKIIEDEIEEAQRLKREQELQIFRKQEEKRKEEEERRKKEEEERQAKYRYNQRNRHYRDANISFDKDKHIYTVNGKVLDSVTTLVNNAFPKFNPQEHAKYTAAKKGMTVQEVIDLWEMNGKESRELGTLLHEKIEKHYQGVNSPDDPTFRLFKMFAKVIELKPYRTEWSVYDYDLGIAGSIDFVDNQNGEYSIYDWKRSERLIVNGLPAKINPYGEKGNYPLEHIDNSPYYHYALQLSIYKYILEHNYNMKIVHLRLGIFHPSYMKPYLLEMPYLEDEVNTLFNLRSEIIF